MSGESCVANRSECAVWLSSGLVYDQLLLHVFSEQLEATDYTCILCFTEQTVREINRVGDGLGLRVHFIRKASDDMKKCGSKLLRKFGKHCYRAGVCTLYMRLQNG